MNRSGRFAAGQGTHEEHQRRIGLGPWSGAADGTTSGRDRSGPAPTRAVGTPNRCDALVEDLFALGGHHVGPGRQVPPQSELEPALRDRSRCRWRSRPAAADARPWPAPGTSAARCRGPRRRRDRGGRGSTGGGTRGRGSNPTPGVPRPGWPREKSAATSAGPSNRLSTRWMADARGVELVGQGPGLDAGRRGPRWSG